MSRPESGAEMPLRLPSDAAADPDLTGLPEPRRPGRRLTLACMAVTIVLALGLAWALRGDAAYALRDGSPSELGNLSYFEPRPDVGNRWVRGEALLATAGAIRYARPLERDTYRLAQVAGNARLWIEMRVPEGLEGPRFVPPTSLVGRLVPMADAGLRYLSAREGVSAVGGAGVAADAWLLVDGETPAGSRWALGVVAMLLGFAAFNVWGMLRLLRPIKDGAAA